jgi:hypothetical protein
MVCIRCLGQGFDGEYCLDCNFESEPLASAIDERGYRRAVLHKADEGFLVYGKSEHVAVAERALGKPLPFGAVVHHHDKNRLNNANTNLVICQDKRYHAILHSRMNMLEKGIDPDTHRGCYACGNAKLKSEFYKDREAWDGCTRICRECGRANWKKKSLVS